MRIAAMILGLLGGLFGLFGSGCAIVIGAAGSALQQADGQTVTNLGWAATVFSIVGLLGSGLAMGRPKVGGVLLLIAAVGGTISVSAAYFFAGALLLVAGLLALFAQKPQRPAVPEQPPAPPVQQ